MLNEFLTENICKLLVLLRKFAKNKTIMGKLFNVKTDKKSLSAEKNVTVSANEQNKLYKPLSDFNWKDANQAEIHQNSIKVYREKYAF